MPVLTAPSTGPVTSKWGPRPPLPDHHGWDFGFYTAGPDYRIVAAAAGKVVRVFWSNTMGWCIEIDHGDGVRTRYCHLADAGVVEVGDQVTRGQHIGTMGSTGTEAVVRGVRQLHLHFEVIVNGARVDPAPHFTGTAGDGTRIIIEKETTMYGIKVTVISKPDPLRGQVPLNAHFIGAGTDPLVWVSNPGPEQLAEVRFAEWDTAAVADRINQVGVRGSGPNLNKVYYRFADLLAYELGGASGVADLTPVLDAIAKVPTADQNGVASRAAMIKD